MAGGRLLADGKTPGIFRNVRVMEEASLLPPQITELALRLGAGFETADSVPAMIAAIEERRAAG
jgi:energy-coupling factor transport system ATP-binding protein